ALLPWQLFSYALTQASNSLVSEQRLISKVYFPRLIVPLSSVLAGLGGFLGAVWLLPVLLAWDGVWAGRGPAGPPRFRAAGPRLGRVGGPVAVGPQRAVSRLPLHDPVPDAVLAIPYAHRVP